MPCVHRWNIMLYRVITIHITQHHIFMSCIVQLLLYRIYAALWNKQFLIHTLIFYFQNLNEWYSYVICLACMEFKTKFEHMMISKCMQIVSNQRGNALTSDDLQDIIRSILHLSTVIPCIIQILMVLVLNLEVQC